MTLSVEQSINLGDVRLELTASGFGGQHSIQLS